MKINQAEYLDKNESTYNNNTTVDYEIHSIFPYQWYYLRIVYLHLNHTHKKCLS